MSAQLILRGVFIIIFNVWSFAAMACTTCNRRLQDGIFNENFFTYLVLMLIPFLIIGLIAGRLYRLK